MFVETELKGVRVFSFSEFCHYPHFNYALSSRQTDSDLGYTSQTTDQLRKKGFSEMLGIDPSRLFTLRQVHSGKALVLNRSAGTLEGTELGSADAFIVTEPGLFAAVRTADCMPVLALVPERRQFVLIHMGWRGARQRILEQVLKEFYLLSGAKPVETVVGLGPCIRSCCYEVGDEVRKAFRQAGFGLEQLFRESHLDLVAAARVQLDQCGVENVLDSGMCTACRTDLFYSYRREATSSRMWTLAGFNR